MQSRKAALARQLLDDMLGSGVRAPPGVFAAVAAALFNARQWDALAGLLDVARSHAAERRVALVSGCAAQGGTRVGIARVRRVTRV